MKSDSKLAQFFEERGSRLSLHSNPVLELGQRALYYVQSGSLINIFSIDKEVENQRHFIASVGPGDIIFFFPGSLENFSKIIADSEHQTELISLAEADITNLIKSEEPLQKELAYELQSWIEKISSSFRVDLQKRKQHYLEQATEVSIGENEVVSVRVNEKKDLNFYWVQVLEGEMGLLDEGQLQLNSNSKPTIISSNVWYHSKKPTKLKILEPLALFQSEDFYTSFDSFMTGYLCQLNKNVLRDKTFKHELDLSRNLEEKLSMQYALDKIKKFFSGRYEKAYKKNDDQICDVLEKLSPYLNYDFVFPAKIEAVQDVALKIKRICNASKIHTRLVRLPNNWWKKDCGPLLGFLKDQNKPVILVRTSTRYYTLIEDDKKIKISPKVIERLSDEAYMFYVPLKEEAKTGWGVIREVCYRFKRTIISIITFGFLSSLVLLLIPLGTRIIFNDAIPKSDTSLLSYMVVGMLCAAIGFALFTYIRTIFTSRLGGIVTHFLETVLWDRVLKLSPGFFKHQTTGNLFWRLFSVTQIREILGDEFTGAFFNAIFSLLFVALMFYFSPVLASLTFFFALLSTGITLLFCKRKRRLLTEALELRGNVNGFATQLIMNVNKIKSASAEKSAFAEWSRQFVDFEKVDIKIKNLTAWVSTFSVFFPIISTLFVYVAIVWWIKVINFPLPDFLGFNIAFSSFLIAFYPINSILILAAGVPAHWERVMPVLQEKLDGVSQGHGDSIYTDGLVGEIRFDNVTFAYDNNQAPTIKNVSFHVQPNEFLAIVGPSGNGKSTLIRLLLGFEKAHSGAIYYDNKDIDSYDLVALRQQLGVVFQNEGLMAGSVYTNIVSGGTYTLDQINEAMRISEFEKDLAEMPMGLNTIIPMDGATLSGGQKQRLLLARALVGNPRILIFDEATSALDNVTQQSVSEHLANLSVSRIVIAQRLSTIQKADRILVLEKGAIIQQGTFDELANQEGLFQEMLKFQRL